jgi:Kef-type K+ transport system membrane component KefB
MTTRTLLSMVVIFSVAALAPVLSEVLKGWVRVPDVVIEIVLGIVVGPAVLAWARPDDIVGTFSQFGLTMLIFLAGFEIDPKRVRGSTLGLAVGGWLISLALALSIGAFLLLEGLVLSGLLVGLALTSTALGTLLPIMRDAGHLDSKFGSAMLAVGAVGEFGPVLVLAIMLSTDNPAVATALLVAFVVIAAVVLRLAVGRHPHWLTRIMRGSLRTSAQLSVRLVVLLLGVLVLIANELGLDILLGAFTAGLVARMFLIKEADDEQSDVIESKLEAIGFGFLIPVFFVVSGIQFDLDALVSSPIALLRLPIFLLLFLFVRGVPALLFRRKLDRSELLPLGVLSATALPLVVVITHLGLDRGDMRPENAAALVGAGMISVLIFPALSLGLLERSSRSPLRAEPSAD